MHIEFRKMYSNSNYSHPIAVPVCTMSGVHNEEKKAGERFYLYYQLLVSTDMASYGNIHFLKEHGLSHFFQCQDATLKKLGEAWDNE